MAFSFQNILDSRKATMAFNFLVMIPRIIFLVVQMIACVILISMFLNNKFDVTDLQAEIMINGFVYGTGGISYYDPLTGRVYPEVIDITQLDAAELDSAFYHPYNNLITAKIVVEKDDGEVIKQLYFNKEWWDNWKPLLALKGMKGIGGITDLEKKLPVIIRDESGNLKSGYVKFQVVQPQSARAKKK